ncbi:hypothetical protein [Flavitalea sp.]|nr:hypothetical protein [Flavitalea sp.]
MKQIFLATSILFLIACNDKPADATTVKGNDTTSQDVSVKDGSDVASGFARGTRICYSNFRNRDTVLLSFTRSDTAISGELTYQFFQKDRNTGIINGTVKGDTIIADYKFNSEGTTSVRQVVFLKRGDELLEGFGDVEENNGKMVFRNVSSLVFDSSMVFSLTDCAKIPAIK